MKVPIVITTVAGRHIPNIIPAIQEYFNATVVATEVVIDPCPGHYRLNIVVETDIETMREIQEIHQGPTIPYANNAFFIPYCIWADGVACEGQWFAFVDVTHRLFADLTEEEASCVLFYEDELISLESPEFEPIISSPSICSKFHLRPPSPLTIPLL